MRTLRRTLFPTVSLPLELQEMLSRRLRELAGFGILALCGLVGLALASWSIEDPSLNHATDERVRNLIGSAGAAIADMLMQLFGLASIALLIPPTLIAWRLASHRVARTERRHIFAWLGGTLLAAGFASGLPVTARWPLPTGLGGLVGDWMYGVPAILLFARNSILTHFLLTAAFGGLAVLCLLAAGGFLFRRKVEERPALDLPMRMRGEPRLPADDPEDEDRHWVSIGAVMHWLLSARAAIGRRISAWREGDHGAEQRGGIGEVLRRVRPSADDEDTGPIVRREPAFEPRTSSRRPNRPVALDDAEPDFDMDEDDDIDPMPALRADARTGPAARSEPEFDDEMPARQAREPAPAPVRAAPAAPAARPRAPMPQAGESEWIYPTLDLLDEPRKQRGTTMTQDALEQNARLLEGVLEDYGVRGEITQVRPGPVVTLYELEPAAGTRSSRVIGLAEDIARSMSAPSARVAVISGRNAIGIELPNPSRETVYLRELLSVADFAQSKYRLALPLGKTIGGEPTITPIEKMPHLLVAGTTGAGKSVFINTLILSLLYRMRPDECRMIMVDPKMLELSVYDGIPHLLSPVVTDMKKAVLVLKWAVREMEERYKKMSKLGVRNIEGYNARAAQAKASGERVIRTVQTGFDKETGEAIYEQEEMDLAHMPFIVIVVDEMADLMIREGKNIEEPLQRLAQMARAAGIHLIMATQRPSVDVITGTIRANFPSRISFRVTTKVDSRTILTEGGAETLLGQGDMLFMAGGGRIDRVHGAFVSDEEVARVVNHLKAQGTPDYLDAITSEAEESMSEADDGAVFDKSAMGEDNAGDDLYAQAIKVVMRDKKCSTSYVQRRLKIGYNKAASLVERMEQEGLVGPSNAAGKREILVYSRDARASLSDAGDDDEE